MSNALLFGSLDKLVAAAGPAAEGDVSALRAMQKGFEALGILSSRTSSTTAFRQQFESAVEGQGPAYGR